MANYPMPSWLGQEPDTAGSFLRAYQASAAVSEAQQRMAQNAQQAQMGFALQEQQMKQNALRQQTMLDVQKAYHQATIGLQQSRLDEAKQRTDLAATAAARKYQAQQAYQKDFNDLVAGGMDDDSAAQAALIRHGPSLGITGAGMAGLAKSNRKPYFVPENLETKEPAHWVEPSGNIRLGLKQGEDKSKLTANQEAIELSKQIKDVAASYPGKLADGALISPKNMDPDLKKNVDRAKKDLAQMRAKLKQITLPEGMGSGSGFKVMRDPKGNRVKVPADDTDRWAEKGYTPDDASQ